MARMGPKSILRADPNTIGGRILLALWMADLFDFSEEEPMAYDSITPLARDVFDINPRTFSRMITEESARGNLESIVKLSVPIIDVGARRVRISLNYILAGQGPALLDSEPEFSGLLSALG